MQFTNLFHPPLTLSQQRYEWGQLHGCALSLAISHAALQHAGPLLIISPDSFSAHQLENELQFFLASENNFPVLHFPDWEILPYDQFSPHQDIISERLTALYQLPKLTRGIVIVSVNTLMHRLAPPEFIVQNSFVLRKNDTFNLETIRQQLITCGYRCVNQVMEHGEFTVRGAIFDIFPMGNDLPYRIELFDEEVESIRTFDPETQLSITTVTEIDLLPAHEFPITESAITHFRQQWRAQFDSNPQHCSLYQDVTQGIAPPGIEYYLPLFFSETSTLFNYLPAATLIVAMENLSIQAEQFLREIQQRYAQRAHDITRPILKPAALFMRIDEIFHHINHYTRIYPHQEIIEPGNNKYNFCNQTLPTVAAQNKIEHALKTLEEFLLHIKHRVLFCAESTGRRTLLLELLNSISIHPVIVNDWQAFVASNIPYAITVASLEQALYCNDPAIVIITESQLFGQQVMQRRLRKNRVTDSDAVIRNLAELRIDAPVVHIDYGVGRYRGLQILTVSDNISEYLVLEYAGGDRIYVPVASLHLISRYSGVDAEHAPLNRLGSDQWAKAKRKAAEKVRDVAVELLEIYAKRAAREGHQFTLHDDYHAFANGFPFEETPDQAQAIANVIADMQSVKPMDRLICGDVGFGKTEVAMRAAFIALHNNKQVAMLVPTTLLAQQHYQTFQDRFADAPVKIELLSRFRTQKESEAVINDIANCKVDLVIGTHKLLNQKINFKNLGLLIIDEEHRFGVRQKERLKALRAEVDILTLTATPLPRTLNMALSMIRDLSIIATPPARRLSIKTFVQEHNSVLIREAITREILRGGQVYFIHNKVQSIEHAANELKTLVPEAKIAVAHGQMHERELERIMSDFYHQRFNVLLCTTIIENGIDIPSANTIIIDRADRLGLAQLHQLRGRVGRSHHQAYAYLMTPHPEAMTADAIKRLEALASLEDLGAGFTLAMHDLEIRGVGELLGEEQSGNIQTIGFSLYSELLERAIKALKQGKDFILEDPAEEKTEINLQITALIPDVYIPDIHTRLILYKRIANAKNSEQLDELQIEMIDRFGLLPEATKNLFHLTYLKLKAEKMGIRKLEANAQMGRIEFISEPLIDPHVIINLLQKQSNIFKLDGPNRLKFYMQMDTMPERIAQVKKILNQLSL